MNRALFLLHRWLGLGLGVLVVLWFASAFVLRYVGFPQLTAAERAAGLRPLPLGGGPIAPATAFAALGTNAAAVRVRLGEFLGQAVYRVQPAPDEPWRLLRAADAQPVPAVTSADALLVARAFAGGTHEVSHDGETDLDQWTVSSGLAPFRPLHRVAVADAVGTRLYVSARTGEVVRDTRRAERLLNYVGAVTHWIYPVWLRRHNLVWRITLRLLSGLALLLPVTGLILGWRRWATARRSLRGARRWHVLLGLTFGLFALTWLFSGFLSLRLVGVFDDGEPTRAQRDALAGGQLNLAAFVRSPADAFANLPPGEAREAELVQFAAQPYYLVSGNGASRRLIPANSTASAAGPIPPERLREQARNLMPAHRLTAFEELRTYDAHYYSGAAGAEPRPLPVWRARFDDPANTWFHLDPQSGQITERLTKGSRAYRWLFNGLHNFDWPWLARRPLVRDVLALTALTGGLATSLLGLRLGWLRLRPMVPGPGNPGSTVPLTPHQHA